VTALSRVQALVPWAALAGVAWLCHRTHRDGETLRDVRSIVTAKSGVELEQPPTDLRDAIARTAGLAIAQCHDDGPLTWHPCGQCQGTPCACSGEPFSVVVADAVLPVVQARIAAEVERARAEGAAEVAEWRGRFCDAGLHLRTHRRDGRCWACDRDARRAACPHEGEPVNGMAVIGPVWDCRTCGKRLREYDGLTYSEMRARFAAGGEQRG
jgi:hypothetical protein